MILPQTPAVRVKCEFMTQRWSAFGSSYSCDGSIESGETSYSLIDTVGAHQMDSSGRKQRTNENVVGLMVRFQPLSFFPKKIHNFFPNLKGMDFEGCQISSISSEDLKPFKHLEEIIFSGNKIREIPHDLFAHNKKLIKIDFEDNWVMHIGHDVFSHLQHVHVIDLRDNACTSVATQSHDEVLELIFELSVNCPPSKRIIANELTTSEIFMKKIKEITDEKMKQMKSHLFGVVKQLQHKVKELESLIDMKQR